MARGVRMRVRVIVKRLAYLDGGFAVAPIAQLVACRTAVHTIFGVASSTPRKFFYFLLFHVRRGPKRGRYAGPPFWPPRQPLSQPVTIYFEFNYCVMHR